MLAVALALGLAVALHAAAAGSITQILPNQSIQAGGRTIRIYDMAWTSSAGGAVQELPIALDTPGALMQVDITPDTGGTQPTDLFDVTLLTAISGGVDLLAGQGADASNASVRVLTFDPPILLTAANLYPTLANAGNAKTGRIRFYIGS